MNVNLDEERAQTYLRASLHPARMGPKHVKSDASTNATLPPTVYALATSNNQSTPS